mmetsp:Transcript_30792/g.94381  ORF Transcript_30792/g.94381 Transcript_30792/m.94381 type:complete len:242 (+) Transcript_30792:134-859(+)|eukprot:scaffold257331_cov27-Tisochrysis_lutea.AAC.3
MQCTTTLRRGNDGWQLPALFQGEWPRLIQNRHHHAQDERRRMTRRGKDDLMQTSDDTPHHPIRVWMTYQGGARRRGTRWAPVPFERPLLEGQRQLGKRGSGKMEVERLVVSLALGELLFLFQFLDLGRILREQKVQEERDEESDAVRRLEDHDDCSARRLSATVVLDAAVAVVVCTGSDGNLVVFFNSGRVRAGKRSADSLRDGHLRTAHVARFGADRGGDCGGGEDLARKRLGPESRVVS